MAETFWRVTPADGNPYQEAAQAEASGASRAPCAECARLESEKTAARGVGDMSRVTDCDVLIERHPHHGTKRAPATRRRT